MKLKVKVQNTLICVLMMIPVVAMMLTQSGKYVSAIVSILIALRLSGFISKHLNEKGFEDVRSE